jgi:hypothetical protein
MLPQQLLRPANASRDCRPDYQPSVRGSSSSADSGPPARSWGGFEIDDANYPFGPPMTLDEMIRIVQYENPAAGIRVTSRLRSVREQADLMAKRRERNRTEFLNMYHGTYITDFDQWVSDRPLSSHEQRVDELEKTLFRVLRNGGGRGLKHIWNLARDISIPLGGPKVQSAVKKRLRKLGALVLNESEASTGSHWHVYVR